MGELAFEEKLDWLQLARSRGIGPTLFSRLREQFGDVASAIEAVPQLVAKGRLTKVRLCDRAIAEQEIAALDEAGITLITACEPNYPERLRAIDTAPPVISVRGRLDLLAAPSLAIVGARNASANGRNLARDLAEKASLHGLTVISGLARGIDTAAHQGAIDGTAGTIAVIASGLDITYPAENDELMERIAASFAVVSERPLGAPPVAKHFLRRNRIISGLALGTLVVEASDRSGSLTTARLALEQGREVMAVPGSPLDARHRGTNRLLRDGACLVETFDDIEACLSWQASMSIPVPVPVAAPPKAAMKPAQAPAKPRLVPQMGEVCDQVTTCLSAEPLPVDELVRQCQASASEVQEALVELELEGRLTRHPGNRVSLMLG